MTLTELSFYSRKFVPFGIIAVLLLLIFYYIIKIALTLPSTNVAPGITYTLTFGKLKVPVIKDAITSEGYKFTLDTIEGRPIEATPSADVFYLPFAERKVAYRIGIENMAKLVGIDIDTVKPTVAAPNYIFTDNKHKLSVNINTFNFSYDYLVSPDDEFFKTAKLPSAIEINNKAVDFLRSMGRYPEELSKGKTNLIYLSYKPDTKELSITKTPEEANMVEVDFYRPDVGAFPIVSTKYFNSPNYVILVFYEGGYKVVRSQVQFFEKSPDQIGKYPIKSGEKAWQQLQEGKGIVVLHPANEKNITIKEMLIGYLDPEEYQEFLQPVYVFLGDKDNNFVAYVPAVDDSQMTK